MTISGQVLIREAGKNPNGKRLVMVVGVWAVPEGTFEGESQYTVSGTTDRLGIVDLKIFEDSRVDRKQEMHGASLGHAVALPIWRV